MRNIISLAAFCLITSFGFAQSNQNNQTTPKKAENNTNNIPENTARIRVRQANIVKAKSEAKIKVNENGADTKKEKQNKTEQPK